MPRKIKEDALKGSYADKLIDAAVDIRISPEAVERSYMARQLVQCTLPHSDPGDVSVWARTNGHLTLAIRPYVDLKTRKPLYPYGSIPRLLLFWLVTEATQKKSRRIRLGNSLDSFMREIGLNPRTGGGKRGDAARLHSQMERLFRAIVTFEDKREWSKSYVDMQIAPRGTLWWNPLVGPGAVAAGQPLGELGRARRGLLCRHHRSSRASRHASSSSLEAFSPGSRPVRLAGPYGVQRQQKA